MFVNYDDPHSIILIFFSNQTLSIADSYYNNTYKELQIALRLIKVVAHLQISILRAPREKWQYTHVRSSRASFFTLLKRRVEALIDHEYYLNHF